MLERRDCAELLRAADVARAGGDRSLARELASACPQEGLDQLAAQAPPEALLWCGRARAAAGKPTCKPDRVFTLWQELKPRLRLGPADPDVPPDALLQAALAEVGPELNFSYDQEDPNVFVGRVKVTVDRSEVPTIAAAPDKEGKKRNVPATLHRVVARAEAQVDMGSRTRTLHANEETRDVTWAAQPRFAVEAKATPRVEGEEPLGKKAVVALLRAIARGLVATPPESIEPRDAATCLAYGLALAVTTADRDAAASGRGNAEKIAACEKLLGMPGGGGIPVP